MIRALGGDTRSFYGGRLREDKSAPGIMSFTHEVPEEKLMDSLQNTGVFRER